MSTPRCKLPNKIVKDSELLSKNDYREEDLIMVLFYIMNRHFQNMHLYEHKLDPREYSFHLINEQGLPDLYS